MLGLVLIPVLSFSKPIIGLKSIYYAFAVTILLALSLFVVICMIACMKYLFAKQRQIPDGHSSWISALTCFLLTLSPALGIIAAAESYGPGSGILVSVVPYLKKDQARFVSIESGQQPETDAQQPSRPPEISFWPFSKTPTSSDSHAKTQDVIAEGIGTSAEDALNDAFRNAVRQVVGAVVDAETLIKNDQVIDDKVLTYSDGIIKKGYEIVPGSSRVKDGLHRIKIEAQVERKSVIERLRAASVIVKAVDGKGLFADTVAQLNAEKVEADRRMKAEKAEAVTKLNATKDAGTLLKKHLESFPQSCIAVSIVGEPKIVKKTADRATIMLTVHVEPDLKAYNAFSARITPILEKVATFKDEFTGKFKRDETSVVEFKTNEHSSGTLQTFPTWIPRAFEGQGSSSRWKSDHLAIAVATSRSKAAERIDYSVYFIDPVHRPILIEIASRTGRGRLQLLDAAGNTIARERFSLARANDSLAGTLVAVFGGPSDFPLSVSELGLPLLPNKVSAYRPIESEGREFVFILSPTFYATQTARTLGHRPHFTIPCELSLSLDELEAIKDAKVEVTFDDSL